MRTGILMMVAGLAFLGHATVPVMAAGDGTQAAPAGQEMRKLFNDAQQLAATKRPQEAMAAYAGMARRWPQIAEVHNNLGVLQMRSGQLAAAESSFDAALKLRPDYAAALENLGDLHARLALGAWEAASRIDGDDPEVRDKRYVLLPLLDMGQGVESASLDLQFVR